MSTAVAYQHSLHAAARTTEYVFNQLIPYIGNKRKLLDLIGQAVASTRHRPGDSLLDLFAGSGVVSRFAKRLGMRVIACNRPPAFTRLGGYERAIATLNALPPRVDWVTRHLCPRDDEDYDVTTERMFYMRKNGMRIDAIRHRIAEWRAASVMDDREEACLLAPLLYQACYRSNTSGVFKGFHRGWGGRTRTALYRIATDLELAPAVFHDNGLSNEVHCEDAIDIARAMRGRDVLIAYIDPPYNQHPYASNYHVLTSMTLWDKPELDRHIGRGSKSAIRTDWRTTRRSAYNHRDRALDAYRELLATIDARFILTSYSTDGTIPLDDLLAANAERGRVAVFARRYKRYRVSSQRYSHRPTTVEFVLAIDTARRGCESIASLRERIEQTDSAAGAANGSAPVAEPTHATTE
jgi:adenine-specific DNA-methyltransferase